MKQKYFLIITLAVCFTLTASAAFANLSFDTDGISGSSGLILDSGTGDVSVEGNLDLSATGREMINNPDFAGNANGWTLGSGWSYDGNKVSVAAGLSGDLSQFTTEAGKYYEVNIVATVDSNSTTAFYVNNGYNGLDSYLVTGTNIIKFRATADALVFINSQNESGSISHFSIKEIPQITAPAMYVSDFFAVGPDESTLDSFLNGYTGAKNLITSSSAGVALGVESMDDGIYVVTHSSGHSTAVEGDADVTCNGCNAIGLAGFAGADGPITAGSLYAIRAFGTNLENGASATNVIGLQVDDQMGGTNNYAIRTGVGTVQFGDVMQTIPTTYASLPTCNSGKEGAMRTITNSTVNTWGATIAGGGANHVLAYCDGTNWIVK